MTIETLRASQTDDLAKLLLRVALGILILFHGISKVIAGPAFVTGALTKIGMPAAFGYLVYIGEVIAPLLVLLGIWTRAAALVIAINMVVAILLVHTKQFFTMSQTGGWALELQGIYLIAAVTIVLLGAGRYSVGGYRGRWN